MMDVSAANPRVLLAILRFEKLDITPKSAQKIKPVLERWMAMAEERYKNGVQNLSEFIGLEPSKKRKRRTSFTPQALELLNEHFERTTHPSGTCFVIQFFTCFFLCSHFSGLSVVMSSVASNCVWFVCVFLNENVMTRQTFGDKIYF